MTNSVLNIQQGHAPKRWQYSLRVRGPHFASKVSYNAGAATDDYAGQHQSPLRGHCCRPLIFLFLASYLSGRRVTKDHKGLTPQRHQDGQVGRQNDVLPVLS